MTAVIEYRFRLLASISISFILHLLLAQLYDKHLYTQQSWDSTEGLSKQECKLKKWTEICVMLDKQEGKGMCHKYSIQMGAAHISHWGYSSNNERTCYIYIII